VFEIQQCPPVHLPFAFRGSRWKEAGRKRTKDPAREPEGSIQLHKLLDTQASTSRHVPRHQEISVKAPCEALHALQQKSATYQARKRARPGAPAQGEKPPFQRNALKADPPQPAAGMEPYLLFPQEERRTEVDESKVRDPSAHGQPHGHGAGQASRVQGEG